MFFIAKLFSRFERWIKTVPLILTNLGTSLSKKERIFLFVAFFVFFLALPWSLFNFYLKKTIVVPASGGTLTEAIVGKPEYLNPVLAKASEADKSIVQLVYSGLMKYSDNGELINDLASGWKANEERTEYTITLKDNLLFHDGTPLTVEDVLFTVNTLKNSRYNSPLYPNWTGIEARTEGKNQIIFSLKKPFTPFLHNLTFGILPKHIWQDVGPEDFQLSEFNKAPIGSGPYQFLRLEKKADGSIDQIVLKVNRNYYLGAPYIETILLKFLGSETEAIELLNQGKVMAINNLSHRYLDKITLPSSKINLEEIKLPRYYAVFLNIYQSKILAQEDVREALDWATCREEILEKALHQKGDPTYSPIISLPILGKEGFTQRNCQPDKAKEILKNAKWKFKKISEDNPKEILFSPNGEPLQIKLATADYPELVRTAEVLKEQWEKIGVEVSVEILSVGDLSNSKIEPRNYEALLFGETLKMDPDPRPYWHSAEKNSPGQNLASYDNVEADELLDRGRAEVNKETRNELYLKFQKLINRDIPAIFLYSPRYLYPISSKVRGINFNMIEDPSRRYSNIEKWYLGEKRIKK
jgi:peptide/nickel transport system substrate-binding protein